MTWPTNGYIPSMSKRTQRKYRLGLEQIIPDLDDIDEVFDDYYYTELYRGTEDLAFNDQNTG